MTLCGLFALWTKSTPVIHGVPGYIQEMGMRKMKEGTCSRLKEENLVLSPKKLWCMDRGIQFVHEDGEQESLDEDRILLACIEQSDETKGERKCLPVEDVTRKTKGRFFLGTVYGTTCEIRTGKLGKTEGELLMEVTGNYPWLWIGGHACLDRGDRREWKELQKMVETMRVCCRIEN